MSIRYNTIKTLDSIKTIVLTAPMNSLSEKPTALRLLMAAERLFAEEGVDAVSTRRISNAAGQRNNSALQYHYASKEALIEAILEYRQAPINQRRMKLLDRLERQDLSADVHALVEAMILPFVELLTGPVEDSYYVSLVSQLYSQQRMDILLPTGHGRARSLYRATEWLRFALPELSADELDQRLILMGLTLNHAVADWAHQRRRDPGSWPAARVHRQAAVLVNFLVGGLRQPVVDQHAWRLLAVNGG